MNPCHCHKVPPPSFYTDPREINRPEEQTSWDLEKCEDTVARVKYTMFSKELCSYVQKIAAELLKACKAARYIFHSFQLPYNSPDKPIRIQARQGSTI